MSIAYKDIAYSGYFNPQDFMASTIFFTPITSMSYFSFNNFLLASGIIQVLNPSVEASFILFSIWLTDLTSPVNPTSPIAIVVSGIGVFLKEEAEASITPKSSAGSFILIPPSYV